MCYSKLMLSEDALKNNAFPAVHSECRKLHTKKRDYNHLGFFFIMLVYFGLWSSNELKKILCITLF